jgi:hypothetical protein
LRSHVRRSAAFRPVSRAPVFDPKSRGTDFMNYASLETERNFELRLLREGKPYVAITQPFNTNALRFLWPDF